MNEGVFRGLFFIACRQFAIKVRRSSSRVPDKVEWVGPITKKNQVGNNLRNIYKNVYFKLTKGYVVQLTDISRIYGKSIIG